MVPVNVFFTCRLCSLKQNAGCEYPGWFDINPVGWRGPPRLGQGGAGRDLAVAGFRIKKCFGIQHGRGVTSITSGLSSCFL